MTDNSKPRKPRRKKATANDQGGLKPGMAAPPRNADGSPGPTSADRAREELAAAAAAGPPEPPSVGSAGRMASTIVPRQRRWYVPDLIPNGELTLVVGVPGAGKSTFGAWLLAKATRGAILPGQEENVETDLLPRLQSAGCCLDGLAVLDQRPWAFPQDAAALVRISRALFAELIWIDPVDSYLGEADENDGPTVRGILESLARVAREVPCTVVATRHPGKDPNNLLPGSRQWRAVPRSLLILDWDQGPPERRWVRRLKPAAPSATRVRHATLTGSPDGWPVFGLGEVIPPEDHELITEADRITRTKVGQAVRLLQRLLAKGEQPSSWVNAQARQEDLDDRIMRRAAQRLGVWIVRRGVGREHASYWSLTKAGTPGERYIPPPDEEAEPV